MMKKLLGILVLGLLWCNVGVAETEQSIMEKHKSLLPKCEGSPTSIKNKNLWMSWDSCFGKLEDEGIHGKEIYASEWEDGWMHGITIMSLPSVPYAIYGQSRKNVREGVHYIIDDKGIWKVKMVKGKIVGEKKLVKKK